MMQRERGFVNDDSRVNSKRLAGWLAKISRRLDESR